MLLRRGVMMLATGTLIFPLRAQEVTDGATTTSTLESAAGSALPTKIGRPYLTVSTGLTQEHLHYLHHLHHHSHHCSQLRLTVSKRSLEASLRAGREMKVEMHFGLLVLKLEITLMLAVSHKREMKRQSRDSRRGFHFTILWRVGAQQKRGRIPGPFKRKLECLGVLPLVVG